MIKRLTIASLLVIMLVLVGGYWSWPYWSSGLLRAVVAGYDLELTSADISRPTLTSMTIEGLAISHTGNRTITNLQSPLVTLSYIPANLLRGRLEAIIVPRLAVDIQPSPTLRSDQSRQSTQTTIPVLLPETLFARSPVERLQIDNLSIDSPLLVGYETVTGTVHLDEHDLAVKLHSSGPEALDIWIMIDRNNTVAATLKLDEVPVIQVDAGVTGSAGQQRFAGQLDIALEETTKRLRPFGLVPADARLAGQLSADWQIALPTTMDDAALKQLRLDGHLASSGTVGVVDTLDAGEFDLRSAFQLSADRLLLNIEEFNLSVSQPMPGVLAGLNPKFTGTPIAIALSVNPGAQVQTDYATGDLAVSDLAGRLAITHTDTGLDSSVQFDGAEITRDDSLSGTANFSATGQLKQVSNPTWSAEQVAINTAGTLSFSSGKVTINTASPIEIKAINIIKDNYLLPYINVISEVFSGLVIDQQAATIASATFSVSSQQVASPSLQVEFPRATVELQDAALTLADQPQLSAAIEISADAVSLSKEPVRLLPINVNARLAIIANKLSGTFDAANVNGLLNTRGEIKHNLGTGKGQLAANTHSVVLSEQDTYLPRILASPLEPVDVTTGQFHVTSKATWDAEQSDVAAEVVLQDIGGFYQRNLFRGLNGVLRMNSDNESITITAQNIEIAAADAGIEISNIRFGLALKDSAIVATDFRAELLGGEVSQKEIVYDWTWPENQFVINLHDIQLGEVLSLESGITGSGSLGGQLPIIVTDSSIRVERGGVSAQAPGGVLKYDAGAPLTGSAANAGLQLTLDALKNFHYTVLTAQVEYAQSGDLALKVSLQGRNPDLEEQRPFLFNLNITENIPTLLKSLQLTQEISDDLDRRIKAFYKTDPQDTLQ